jgi:hypothetical protein
MICLPSLSVWEWLFQCGRIDFNRPFADCGKCNSRFGDAAFPLPFANTKQVLGGIANEPNFRNDRRLVFAAVVSTAASMMPSISSPRRSVVVAPAASSCSSSTANSQREPFCFAATAAARSSASITKPSFGSVPSRGIGVEIAFPPFTNSPNCLFGRDARSIAPRCERICSPGNQCGELIPTIRIIYARTLQLQQFAASGKYFFAAIGVLNTVVMSHTFLSDARRFF